MGCLSVARGAEVTGPNLAIESAAYRDQDWVGRLALMKELTARFRANNCPIALTPEDLMRKVDTDIMQRWDPERASAGMGMRVCEMLSLDFAKCTAGE
jgi:hypothetical protein